MRHHFNNAHYQNNGAVAEHVNLKMKSMKLLSGCYWIRTSDLYPVKVITPLPIHIYIPVMYRY